MPANQIGVIVKLFDSSNERQAKSGRSLSVSWPNNLRLLEVKLMKNGAHLENAGE